MNVGVIILLFLISLSLSVSSLVAGFSSTTSPPPPPPPPPPVDCEYREKDTYTKCIPIYSTLTGPERARSTMPTCGENVGQQYKEIEVIKEPEHGGKECPVKGEKRFCSIECKDCKGEFKPAGKGGYSNSWFNFRRKWATTRYSVKSPAGPGGKECPYKDGQMISIISKNTGELPYDFGQKCGKFVGQTGDATNDDVFRDAYRSYKDANKVKKFDSNVKSYHKISDKEWCAVHK